MNFSIEPSRISKDEYYLNIALAVSKRSTCLKRRYGCVIVNDDIIVSTGYNGSPRGEENCCDVQVCKREDAPRYHGYEDCVSVHAEQNALIVADPKRLKGATVYIACEEFRTEKHSDEWGNYNISDFYVDKNPMPCTFCLRMLMNAGVKRIVNMKGDIYVRD